MTVTLTRCLYPIPLRSANRDTVSGFDNSFHGMIHLSVNTQKIGRGGFGSSGDGRNDIGFHCLSSRLFTIRLFYCVLVRPLMIKFSATLPGHADRRQRECKYRRSRIMETTDLL